MQERKGLTPRAGRVRETGRKEGHWIPVAHLLRFPPPPCWHRFNSDALNENNNQLYLGNNEKTQVLPTGISHKPGRALG